MQTKKFLQAREVVHVGVADEDIGNTKEVPWGETIQLPEIEKDRPSGIVESQVEQGIVEGTEGASDVECRFQNGKMLPRRWVPNKTMPFLTAANGQIII